MDLGEKKEIWGLATGLRKQEEFLSARAGSLKTKLREDLINNSLILEF